MCRYHQKTILNLLVTLEASLNFHRPSNQVKKRTPCFDRAFRKHNGRFSINLLEKRTLLFGTSGWIRAGGLKNRSHQVVKRETTRA